MAQLQLLFHHGTSSLHPASIGAVSPTDSLPSLCSGLDMEERTRQMKLKMNKYKPGAGSDSRLEQDYHKVPHLCQPWVCVAPYSCSKHLPVMCCLCSCAGPCGAFRKSGVRTRAHFNDVLCSYTDNANKNLPEQKQTLQTTSEKSLHTMSLSPFLLGSQGM